MKHAGMIIRPDNSLEPISNDEMVMLKVGGSAALGLLLPAGWME